MDTIHPRVQAKNLAVILDSLILLPLHTQSGRKSYLLYSHIHPTPRLLTSTAITVVPVTITSDLLSPLLPHSPPSTQQAGGHLRIYCLFPLTADPMEAHAASGTSRKLDH